ncbi:helix-turn-helix domain-containing protein [Corynebacterium pacaense]|uniref:helix-turn-helix domain-containing protein n=1 Tax=Corynebacterium pacaense TaxID=1816684 RepID=UPI001178B263|nr:AraC family transcriptional regulator [Corynebacterium pacaense]
MFLNRQILNTPMLMWIRRGTADLRIGRTSIRLSTGQAALCPAGEELHLRADDSSVVIPVPLPAERNVTFALIEVSARLGERLMYEFAQCLGYLKTDPDRREFLDSLLTAVSAGTPLSPPLPRDEYALKAARRIITHPVDNDAIADMARRIGISERTLQRRFHEETGMSISVWRTRTRLSLALSYLSDGHSAEWAAHHVGFSGASSLSRALKTHAGMSPGQVRRRNRGLWRDISQLEVGEIPASTTWTRINGSHIMVWAYRGTSTAQVAGREILLEQGDALILPAGLRLDVRSPGGSLLLPVGFRTPTAEAITAEQLRVIHCTESVESLINCAVFTYTPLKPAHHPTDRAFLLLNRQGTPSGMATDAREALTIAVRIAQRRQVDKSMSSRVRADAFTASTGTDFQRWSVIRRMTLARIQLSRGLQPSVVARNLGYSHLSAFSRAFSATHGLSPTDFQSANRQIPGPVMS